MTFYSINHMDIDMKGMGVLPDLTLLAQGSTGDSVNLAGNTDKNLLTTVYRGE